MNKLASFLFVLLAVQQLTVADLSIESVRDFLQQRVNDAEELQAPAETDVINEGEEQQADVEAADVIQQRQLQLEQQVNDEDNKVADVAKTHDEQQDEAEVQQEEPRLLESLDAQLDEKIDNELEEEQEQKRSNDEENTANVGEPELEPETRAEAAESLLDNVDGKKILGDDVDKVDSGFFGSFRTKRSAAQREHQQRNKQDAQRWTKLANEQVLLAAKYEKPRSRDYKYYAVVVTTITGNRYLIRNVPVSADGTDGVEVLNANRLHSSWKQLQQAKTVNKSKFGDYIEACQAGLNSADSMNRMWQLQ